MQRISTVFLLLTLSVSLFLSCDSLETKVPASEIKKASSWSKKDQFPSFPDCESLEGDELRKCFGEVLGNSISTYLATQELIASRSIDAEIILVIEVDKEGVLSLSKVEDPNYIASDIAELETTLAQALTEAPKALPATKTNVGTYVNVSVKLPIQIIAQPADE